MRGRETVFAHDAELNGAALIQAARDLIPILLERADETDRERRVPDETFHDFQRAGLFRTLKPRRYGGLQLGLFEHASIAMELARGCGSSGWIFSLLDEGSWFVSLLSRTAQDEVWSDNPEACVAGSIRPNASASRPKRVAGGYRMSGQFKFTSGCDHATWIFVGASVVLDESGDPQHHLFLIPKRELQIVDDWFVMGMRGTGSRMCIAEYVFVPDHRVAKFSDMWNARMPGVNETPDWPLLRAPRGSLNPFVASAPVVGVALGAVDAFKRIVTGPDPRGLRAQQHAQFKYAQSSAEAAAARLIVEADVREAQNLIETGKPITPEVSARHLRDAAFVGLLSRDCVDRLHGAVGAAGAFEGHPLGRALRDVHTGITQVGVQWETGALPFSLLELGLGLPPPGPLTPPAEPRKIEGVSP